MKTMKAEVREMKRTKVDGNLYKEVRPARRDKKFVDSELPNHLSTALRNNDRVSIKKFTRNRFRRGLIKADEEFPYPVSPKIGPYVIKNPLFGAKNYYWCSCGMSSKQPFCDSSHVGTEFKPIKFSLDSPTD